MHKMKIVAMSVVALSLALAGCTAGNSAPPDDDGTLRMAFSFAMQQPDPDIFFQAQGLNVTMAAYEGLLRHVPNAETPEIEPWLAESFEVSDDGMAYTFRLRDGVVFHDGTPFDAEAVKFSFERRGAIAAGPSQSLHAFDFVEVVDSLTAVVHLTQPSTEFIPFLASAYGQKMVSPGVLEHEIEGDLGQEWLKTNSAGTGAYTISEFTSQRYVLTAFEDYWGEPAGFDTVEITIEPNFTSQVLQLESGSLDLMTYGIPTADLERLESAGFTINEIPTFNRVTLFLNPDAPALESAEGRLAIAAAIDRAAIVEQVYGNRADLATQMFPAGLLPDGAGEYIVSTDVAAAAAYVDSLAEGDRVIDMAYLSDDPDNQQIAQLLQVQLQAVGLEVSARAMTQPESFELPATPDARPDILLVGGKSSDAAHPDPFARLFYYNNAPLAYFQPQVALDADALVDQGRVAATLDEALTIYGQAADAYAASGLFIPIADRPEIIVTRPGLGGVEHEFNAVSSIRLASLRAE